jgi:2-polyprenyl-3-methyl-5-hydroxy-6-metoxy-1,4-benzoquinol methylase
MTVRATAGDTEVVRVSAIQPTAFVQSWYDAAQAEHFWMKRRFDFLRDAFAAAGISSEEHLSVLDIGSGNGVIRNQIEDSTQWTVDCADIDEHALKSIRGGRGKNLLYDIHDVNPAYAGKYDVVLLLDVVEHIEKPVPFLDAAIKHLKPGGALVINVPALMFLFSRYDVCAGHFRRYNQTTLGKELDSLPVRRVYAKYWGATFVPALMLRKVLVRRIKEQEGVIRMGFEAGSPAVNALFSSIFAFERAFLPWRPLGTSLIYVGRKS